LVRDGAQAIVDAMKACELFEWHEGKVVDTLAAAYAEAGNFDAAVEWQRRAIELAHADVDFIIEARDRLALYRDHKPCRESTFGPKLVSYR